MAFIHIILIYRTTFILVIIVCTRDSMIQHLVIFCTYVTFTYIHGVVALPSFTFPLLPFAPLAAPFSISLCAPFPLTWRPPAVTGIVLPLLRLLVN
jgi:hypothetical protein